MSERHANRLVSILYRYGQRFFSCRLRPAGMDVGVMPAFMQACFKPGITQEGITANTGMDKGTTARSVKQLEESGLISRKTDEMDRRVQHVYPTARALELLPHVEAVIEELHGVLYRGFSEEEIVLTVQLLKRMEGNLVSYYCKRNAEENTAKHPLCGES